MSRPGRNRAVVIRVPCTQEEADRIKRKADELGLSMTQWLRALALAAPATPPDGSITPRVGMRLLDRSFYERAQPRLGTVVKVEEPRQSVRVWVEWDAVLERRWSRGQTVISARSLHRDPTARRGFAIIEEASSSPSARSSRAQ